MDTDTENVTNEIRALQRRADRNAHGHIRHSLRLEVINGACNFLVVIGGIIIMAASALLLGSNEPYKGAEICVAICSAVITLVGVWQVILQPDARSRKHKEWSLKFLIIEDQCRLALAASDNQQIGPLLTQYQQAVEQADFVPQHRWKSRNQKQQSRPSAP